MSKKRLLIASVLAALSSQVVYGQTYTVINTNDSGAGSLRQAISDANAFGGAATINFSITNSTINLGSMLPVLSNPNGITINGNNNTINGGSTSNTTGDRIFFIGVSHGESAATTGFGSLLATTNTTWNINNLTIQNGNARGGSGTIGGGGAGLGGAIFLNAGNLSLSGVNFSGNRAIGGNSAVGGGGGGGGMGGNGGISSGGGFGLGANGGGAGQAGLAGSFLNAAPGGTGAGGPGGSNGGGGGGHTSAGTFSGGGGGVGGGNSNGTTGGNGGFGGGGGAMGVLVVLAAVVVIMAMVVLAAAAAKIGTAASVEGVATLPIAVVASVPVEHFSSGRGQLSASPMAAWEVVSLQEGLLVVVQPMAKPSAPAFFWLVRSTTVLPAATRLPSAIPSVAVSMLKSPVASPSRVPAR